MSQEINNKEAVSGATKSTDVENKTYEKDSWATRTTEIPSNMTKRFAWSGGNCVYAGSAPRSLAEGTDGWLLQKFTYDGSDQCTNIEIAYGNWTAHATEDYA